jgi:hypothetical protein
LCRAFITDREVIPENPYGDWNETMLVDEDLAQEINLFLQELGTEITAQKLVNFLAQPEIKAKYGITKDISLRTAHSVIWRPWGSDGRKQQRASTVTVTKGQTWFG